MFLLPKVCRFDHTLVAPARNILGASYLMAKGKTRPLSLPLSDARRDQYFQDDLKRNHQELHEAQ